MSITYTPTQKKGALDTAMTALQVAGTVSSIRANNAQSNAKAPDPATATATAPKSAQMGGMTQGDAIQKQAAMDRRIQQMGYDEKNSSYDKYKRNQRMG